MEGRKWPNKKDAKASFFIFSPSVPVKSTDLWSVLFILVL